MEDVEAEIRSRVEKNAFQNISNALRKENKKTKEKRNKMLWHTNPCIWRFILGSFITEDENSKDKIIIVL